MNSDVIIRIIDIIIQISDITLGYLNKRHITIRISHITIYIQLKLRRKQAISQIQKSRDRYVVFDNKEITYLNSNITNYDRDVTDSCGNILLLEIVMSLLEL